jgi:hypothetical protein
MGAWYIMYNKHIYTIQHFFLYFFLTSGQAGWPRTFMSGTLTLLCTTMHCHGLLECFYLLGQEDILAPAQWYLHSLLWQSIRFTWNCWESWNYCTHSETSSEDGALPFLPLFCHSLCTLHCHDLLNSIWLAGSVGLTGPLVESFEMPWHT